MSRYFENFETVGCVVYYLCSWREWGFTESPVNYRQSWKVCIMPKNSVTNKSHDKNRHDTEVMPKIDMTRKVSQNITSLFVATPQRCTRQPLICISKTLTNVSYQFYKNLREYFYLWWKTSFCKGCQGWCVWWCRVFKNAAVEQFSLILYYHGRAYRQCTAHLTPDSDSSNYS